jgi:hypothetical protein
MPLFFTIYTPPVNESGQLARSAATACHKIQEHGKNGEKPGSDSCQLFQDTIHAAPFGFPKKRIGSATDRAKTLGIAFLKNNQHDQSDADKNINNSQYNRYCVHL